MTTREKEKEILDKYGQLNWNCQEGTDEEKAEAGKRYEGCNVLMNLENGSILQCFVKKVTKEGFHVRPFGISGFANETDDDDLEYYIDHPVPFSKFFAVFLAP